MDRRVAFHSLPLASKRRCKRKQTAQRSCRGQNLPGFRWVSPGQTRFGIIEATPKQTKLAAAQLARALLPASMEGVHQGSLPSWRKEHFDGSRIL